MPRYAVLSHDWPTPHFDLLLENGDVCLTWRLAKWPPIDGMPVERIGDHRPVYLDYDGPVSGDRGMVTTVERGEFEWLCQNNPTVRVSLGSPQDRRTVEIGPSVLSLLFVGHEQPGR